MAEDILRRAVAWLGRLLFLVELMGLDWAGYWMVEEGVYMATCYVTTRVGAIQL